MKNKQLLIIFLPAFLLLALFLFVRIVQYEPLRPKIEKVDPEQQEKEKSNIPIFPEDPILGDKKAATSLIVFADFGCEQCKNEYIMIKQLIAEYPKKIKIIWKGLPVTKFPYESEPAHMAAYCANKQGKFEAFSDLLFENQHSLDKDTLATLSSEAGLDTNQLQTCMQSADAATHIQNTKDLAKLLNVQAVPTLFLNNNQISAPQSMDDWKALLSL